MLVVTHALSAVAITPFLMFASGKTGSCWHSLIFELQVMKWMEQCAYIAASRVGRVGDVMYITAQVRNPFVLPPPPNWLDACHCRRSR